MLYAVGEIVLVVIGILIALSINNWNEAKQTKEFEHKMLAELKKALTYDLDFFENHLIGNRMQAERKAAEFFENYLLTDSIIKDSIDYHFVRLINGLQVTYNIGPYEALKSTGIDKISNDSLRNKIIDLYEFKLPRYSGLISQWMDFTAGDMRKYHERLDGDTKYVIENSEISYTLELRPIDLKSNQDFISLLSISSNRSKDIIVFLQSAMSFMEDVVGKIDKELNTN